MSDKLIIKTSKKPKEPDFVVLRDGEQLLKANGWDNTIESLKKAKEQEERIINVSFSIKGLATDIYVQLNAALQEIYGYTQALMEGFWGNKPPSKISIKIGPVTSSGSQPEIQVFVGKLAPPAWEGGYLAMHMNPNDPMSLNVAGQLKQKFEPSIVQVIQRTKELIKTQSIYKGQPVELELGYMAMIRAGVEVNPIDTAPTFIPGIDDPPIIVLPRDIQNSININLWDVIRNPDDFRYNKVDVKSGVVFAGEPGTGKTLACLHTAKIAVDSGFSYFKLTDPQWFIDGYNIAQFYAPSVYVIEDVEKIFGGPRTPFMDQILDRLDGVATKGSEVIVICTSNNPDIINDAIRRSGRIGERIEFRRLDADAAGRFIKICHDEFIAPDVDMVKVGDAFDDLVPADIDAGVTLAKRIAIGKIGREIRKKLTTQMLVDGVELLKRNKGLYRKMKITQAELNLGLIQTSERIKLGQEVPVEAWHIAREYFRQDEKTAKGRETSLGDPIAIEDAG